MRWYEQGSGAGAQGGSDGAEGAGADVLVCGNAVFKADDPRAAIGAVKDAADEAREAALARGQWN